jgi:hypothetical protein
VAFGPRIGAKEGYSASAGQQSTQGNGEFKLNPGWKEIQMSRSADLSGDAGFE